jgi:hypothetical protein
MSSKGQEECKNCEPIITTTTPQTSNAGLYGALTVGALAIGLSIATIPFVTPAMRKHPLPYIPATTNQIKNIWKALAAYSKHTNGIPPIQSTPQKRIKLIDLGSGDGRIVFEAAKRGYDSTGVELNYLLVLFSKIKSFTNWNKNGNKSLTNGIEIMRPKFQKADFWKVPMSEYDLIIVFGVQEMMKDLSRKLRKEMKPDCLVVVCRWPIDTFKSTFRYDDELDSVWIYKKDALIKSENADKSNEQPKQNNQDDDDDDD